MFPGMVSIFEWKGVREQADEVAMIIKTRAALVEAVLEETKRLHPYELPALLVLSTEGGSAEYCGWIVSQTTGPEPQ
jgi:periplasmic divalent cation tolerance protein